jgi:TetR/AcrR family transcriptional regulator, repressor of fatR-cypB operon
MDQNKENISISRKDREKMTREREILQAARAIFAEKGYHDTTLEEIAHKAEFAKGTIYNYFANKDELFYGIIDGVFDEVYALITEAVNIEGVGAREKMTAYAKAVITHAIKQSDLFKLMMRELPRFAMTEFDTKIKHFHQRELEARELIAHVIAEEMKIGRLKSYDPMEAAFLFDGMLRIYCMNHIKSVSPLSAADIDRAVELIIAVFFDGIKST